MGKTFPNLAAERVERPGYYFNERLCKLARLHQGQKLPAKVGAWLFIADEDELTSSQVVRKLMDLRPDIDLDHLTYTVRSPLDRRLPLGDPPRRRWLKRLAIAAALLAIGYLVAKAA